MTIDLCVWDRCNNRCLMCTNPDRPWPAWDGDFNYDFESIIGRLEKFKEKIKAADSVYLTGGEPTLHPQFLNILKYLAGIFPEQRLNLLTNGRRFIYQDFVEKVLEVTDNFEIDLSLCGPRSEIHDAVTRTQGSFEQTIKGLENLLKNKKKKQIVGVRTVLNQFSYKYIGQTLELLRDKFSSLDRVIIIFPEFEAQAIKNIKRVKINYTQTKPYIDGVYPLLSSFKEIRFYHFPLCTVGKKIWPYLWRTLPASEVKFVKVCGKCNYKHLCLGIHKGYLENISKKDFSPIQEKIDMELTGDIYRPIHRVAIDSF